LLAPRFFIQLRSALLLHGRCERLHLRFACTVDYDKPPSHGMGNFPEIQNGDFFPFDFLKTVDDGVQQGRVLCQ